MAFPATILQLLFFTKCNLVAILKIAILLTCKSIKLRVKLKTQPNLSKCLSLFRLQNLYWFTDAAKYEVKNRYVDHLRIPCEERWRGSGEAMYVQHGKFTETITSWP